MKTLLRHSSVARLVAALLALYARLMFITCRVRYATPVPAIISSTPVMFAAWHQQIAMLPVIKRPSPFKMHAMMSASRDGTFMRAIAVWFGIGAVVGSSSRGAVAGARAMVQAAARGNSLFITPDGPRGPARIAKSGTTGIARISGLPLIPTAAWPLRGKTFASWDSFRLPYPFTTIVVAYGEPLATLTPEALSAALNTLTAQAQGTVPLAPAAPKN